MTASSRLPFIVMSTILLAYALFLQWLFRAFGVQEISIGEKEHVNLAGAFKAIQSDRVLLLFLFGGLLATVVHGLTKFSIGVAFCEVVPILLLVAGFATMQTGLEFNNLLLPLVCTFFSMIIAAVFIFLQTKVDVTQEMRGKVYTFAMIGLSIAISIPFFH